MRSSKIYVNESVLNELIFSIPFSFIYTHVVLGLQRDGHYFGILLEKEYLLIFLPRLLVSFLLILLVKFITRALDRKNAWDKGILPRLPLQVVFGMLAVSFIDYLASVLICTIKGINIDNTGYFEIYFLPISIYITLINIFYNYQYFLPQKRIHMEHELKPGPEVGDQHSSFKGMTTEIIEYAINKDVVYVSISDGVHFAKDKGGQTIFWPYNLTDSSIALPSDQFSLVTRSLIVHRDIIRELIPIPKNHELTVVLKHLHLYLNNRLVQF